MKGGVIICYIQIIAKIRTFDVSSSYKNGEGYTAFLQYVIEEVLTSQPLYLESFYNLVHNVLDGKKWNLTHLGKTIGVGRTTLYNHLTDLYNTKDMTILICISLGLDLVMTMVFMISRGYLLRYNNYSDRKIMEFINTNKRDGFDRIGDFCDYVEKNNIVAHYKHI